MKKNKHIYDMFLIALFAVFMAVCAWLSIPLVIPITMQTFGVFLALHYLGGKRGLAAILVYLLLGMVGLPVFANFSSGIGVLLSTHGGYMVGWLLAGLVMWLFQALWGDKLWVGIVSMLAGLTVCYATGLIWFMVAYTQHTGPMGIWTAIMWCVVPMILPDLAKLGLALWVSVRLQKIRKKS